MTGKLTVSKTQFWLPNETEKNLGDKNGFIYIYPNAVTTRDLIISILFQECPLTTKEIYHKVKRHNGNSITYQAIHKQLKKLLQQGIITKNNEKHYIITEQWLEWLTSQAMKLKQKYQSISNNHEKEYLITKNQLFS